MKHNEQFLEKVFESISAVLPITAIVLVLSITIAPMSTTTLILFLFGALLLVLGMGFFSLGAEISMTPLGDGIGVQMSKSKKKIFTLLACFVLGIIITIAEPDLQVLAQQVASIPNMVLIMTVAIGVGIFLLIAQLRILFKIPLTAIFIIFYGIIFILAFLTSDSMVPVSFDSGGVTTGPITVPFIMALGVGMASIRSDKNSSTDSFGLVGICSIGPILSVLLLGFIYRSEDASYEMASLLDLETTADVAKEFLFAFPHYAKEVGIAVFPIIVIFILFQLVFKRFHSRQLIKMISGFIYTYVGLVVFLTGVNVGFMPAGQYIGATIAESNYKWLLIPIGMLIGYFIVKAEPAVQVLEKQVEDVTNGAISRKSIGLSLSIGIALSVGLAMLRILTGLNIMWFLLPGYAIALIMTFFVPQLFTGIAFDSGGVASGPMTATFLLPLAMGACDALNGNIMTDAFGIVAMVAMTPLLTIQLMGLASNVKQHVETKRLRDQLSGLEDTILYFD
ncbi:DUF1538 domain-containing protein [Lachnospiraceae bacterium OttesenSCG-928-D06]|nr:DUF1538 domain-containing protein [Lachnospiraceae bacterium OttesenSCG-928-D06]